ncbi:formate dehydrogenase accessory sulfurtransferase FdhD [Sphingomonas sp. 28-63-12]|uniref:formate dehydrogenase accessory sulfurtransferase FdhD n=1 Tax=Sphingomonas sp. 28-63-12 TaxID=1970434 RepID=UPI000BCB9F53|nr:MAG: sulfurtransferase FdhD [Sphingomonas sp. 28-63-12]
MTAPPVCPASIDRRATLPATFVRVAADGAAGAITRAIAVEQPVAIEYNGIGYAVLMATPHNLHDLVVGFSHAERLIEQAVQIEWIEPHDTDRGVIVRVGLAADRAALINDRTRARFSDSSCGLCGLENLDQAIRPLPTARGAARADDVSIFAALTALGDHQPLNRLTGAVHAAALCAADGTIRLVREDVGRHNAFDKLIGAMLRAGLDWEGGFALLTSRCSYELVEKAALARCPLLVTISAPTSLAVAAAQQARLPLAVLARPDALLRVDPT